MNGSTRGAARPVKERYNKLKREYGSDFEAIAGSTLGWTRGIVPQCGQHGLERLDSEVGLDHFRPFYRLSSDAIHTGAGAGIAHWLGDPWARVSSLGAASKAGLADPGQLTAIYITLATEVLLSAAAGSVRAQRGWHPVGGSLEGWAKVWLDMMEELTNAVRDRFAAVDEQVCREDGERTVPRRATERS